MSACYCMGPQNGEPLCPCLMRMRARERFAAVIVDRWMRDRAIPATPPDPPPAVDDRPDYSEITKSVIGR